MQKINPDFFRIYFYSLYIRFCISNSIKTSIKNASHIVSSDTTHIALKIIPHIINIVSKNACLSDENICPRNISHL